MDTAACVREIIDTAMDDYIPLREVYYIIRDSVVIKEDIYVMRVAQELVLWMLNSDFIALFLDDFQHSTEHTRVAHQVASNQVRALVLKADSWHEYNYTRLTHPIVAIASTDAGEQAYASGFSGVVFPRF